MPRTVFILMQSTAWALMFLGHIAPVSGQVDRSAEDVAFFESRIRPVLVQHCYECHSSAAADAKGGLLLDHRGGLRNGGESGPAVVPGRPEQSLLIDAMQYASYEMPPAGKLPEQVLADFQQWIRRGAVDPRVNAPSASEAAAESWKSQLAQRSNWWSLQPPRQVAVPDCTTTPTPGRGASSADERSPAAFTAEGAWRTEPVDRFVRSALQQADLTPATPADASILLRRLSFVLTGLPPQPAQVKAFEQAFASDADAALESVVDELLNSPHFGERIARHWMDVVRYTDTYGYEWDIPAKGSWEYRDYLIRAFNNDVGFDQLIREQIAGDLLPDPRINTAEGLNESMIGPMFYNMGEHRHGSSLAFNGIHQEMVNNKIDAFSKAFLGMTVACARCHDHKLDAISQSDYYALAGVFMTPRWTARSIDVPEKHDTEIVELKRLREQIQHRVADLWQANKEPLASGISLRTWALEHRGALETAEPEDISWPFAQLLSNNDAANTWQQLVNSWQTTHEVRRKANATAFTVLTDFSTPGFPDGWVVEGAGIRHGYVTDGTPLISLDGEQLISQLLPRGVHTHALSSRLSGALRLPAPEQFPCAIVSLQLAGGEWAGRRAIPQNAFLNEGPVFFDATAPPGWTAIAATAMTNGVTRVLTEISTAALNSNFPPRTGVATAGSVTLPDTDEGHDKRSWFSVTGIVAHDAAGAPADTLEPFAALYTGHTTALDSASTTEQVWQRLSDWLTDTVDRWANGMTRPGDVKVLNWLLATSLLPNDAAMAPQIATLVNRYREVESQIAFPRTANSMDEREVPPVNYRVNLRGNVDEDGPAVRRNFL